MSGTAFCKPWSIVPSREWPLKLAKVLGYTGKANDRDLLEFLEKPDGMTIVQATKKVLTFEEEIGQHILYAFGPVVEPYRSPNCFIPEDPVLMARKAWSTGVDLMIGATSNEGILRANSEAEKISEIMQNVTYFAPLNELGVDLKSEKAKDYGKKIMELYYGKSKPSASNQQPYLSVKLLVSFLRHDLETTLLGFSSFLIYISGMAFNVWYLQGLAEKVRAGIISTDLTLI